VSIDADTAAFVQSIKRPVHIVAIAEDWCGDVVRHAPVLHKIAELSDNVRVRFIAREDHPDVFARFLTVGGEAIPKFIFLSDEFVECGHWGPMPADCRELIARGKACGDLKTARERVMEHYQDDPTCTQVVKELRELLEIAACDAP
jgi:thiol-disulfide isomerase/thioredoxin